MKISKKKLFFSCTFLIFCSIFVIGQVNGIKVSSEEDWISVWGGPQEELGGYMVIDSNDFLYVTGSTTSFGNGNFDVFLLKYDNNGNLLWNRTWGQSGADYGHGIAIDSNDNLYIVGASTGIGVNQSAIILKYDPDGVFQWNQSWGGTYNDVGYAVAVDSADNVTITGQTRSFGNGGSDIFVAKYDSLGAQQWNETWGGTQDESAYGITFDSNDNIFITGYTSSFGAGKNDIIFLKYYINGNHVWDVVWGGSGNEQGEAIAIDSNDDLIIAGSTYSFGAGLSDYCLIKFNASAFQVWNTTWGGQYNDKATSLAVAPSDHILLCGSTDSFGIALLGNLNIVLYDSNSIEINSTLWFTNIWHLALSIQLDSSLNVYCAGTADYTALNIIFIIKNPQVDRPIQPGIPGYNAALLILLATGIIVFLIIRQRFNNKK